MAGSSIEYLRLQVFACVQCATDVVHNASRGFNSPAGLSVVAALLTVALFSAIGPLSAPPAPGEAVLAGHGIVSPEHRHTSNRAPVVRTSSAGSMKVYTTRLPDLDVYGDAGVVVERSAFDPAQFHDAQFGDVETYGFAVQQVAAAD